MQEARVVRPTVPGARTTGPTYKVIIVGDSGVGKTTMLRWLLTRTFEQPSSSTIGVDFRSVEVSLPSSSTAPVRLDIWDTAGQERFAALVQAYYRDADAVLFVYALDDEDSLETLDTLLASERGLALLESAAVCFLVGTKADRPHDTCLVERSHAYVHANRRISQAYECSARTGVGIDSIFVSLARSLLGTRPASHGRFQLTSLEDTKAVRYRTRCC